MAYFEVKVFGTADVLTYLNFIQRTLDLDSEQALDNVAHRARGRMTQLAPKGATGRLRQAIRVRRTGNHEREIGVLGSFGSESSPRPAAYAEYVEEGAPAHMPNIEDVARRYGIILGGKGSKDKSSFIKWRYATAIARGIARKPTQATKFVERTKDEAEDIFYREISSLVDRAIGL